MKNLLKVVLICFLLTLQVNCELQSDLFKKITTLKNNETSKEVFLSKIIEETWMGSAMLCADHGMEFLRIETQEESFKVFRALKLHWLEFDDELYIDGHFGNNRIWKFMTNGDEIDPSIFYFLQDNLSENYSVGDFVKVIKNGTIPGFGLYNLEREKRKFLCQKTSPNDGMKIDEDQQHGPIKIEVSTRIFEKIGSFESFKNSKFVKSIFLINRNAGLSFPKASRFCQNFGMKLVHIDSREKYEALVKLLVTTGIGIDTNFMIGDLRQSFLEAHSWANTINLNGNQGRKEQCISIYLNRLHEKGKMIYFDCNDDYKYQRFICEKELSKETWTEEYPKEKFKAQKLPKRTTGMNFLGSVQICKKTEFARTNAF